MARITAIVGFIVQMIPTIGPVISCEIISLIRLSIPSHRHTLFALRGIKVALGTAKYVSTIEEDTGFLGMVAIITAGMNWIHERVCANS